MKPLTSLVMALLLGPSVEASPSREEFVIEATQESEEITGIQEAFTGLIRPLRPLSGPLRDLKAPKTLFRPLKAL